MNVWITLSVNYMSKSSNLIGNSYPYCGFQDSLDACITYQSGKKIYEKITGGFTKLWLELLADDGHALVVVPVTTQNLVFFLSLFCLFATHKFISHSLIWHVLIPLFCHCHFLLDYSLWHLEDLYLLILIYFVIILMLVKVKI